MFLKDKEGIVQGSKYRCAYDSTLKINEHHNFIHLYYLEVDATWVNLSVSQNQEGC